VRLLEEERSYAGHDLANGLVVQSGTAQIRRELKKQDDGCPQHLHTHEHSNGRQLSAPARVVAE
jgi:hypothetical protein